jgi:hypothetical protein
MMPYNAAFNLAAQLAELRDAQQSVPGACASSVHGMQLERRPSSSARGRLQRPAEKRPLRFLRRLFSW